MTPPVNLEQLTKAFPTHAIKYRDQPGGGGAALAYIPGHLVIHRLNDATTNAWSFSIDGLESRPAGTTRAGEQKTLWIVRGTLTIPGLGSRSNIGVQITTEKAEDLMKGAATDCLKKCATMFGVGLELYGDDLEGADDEVIDAETGEITTRSARPAPQPKPASQQSGKQYADDNRPDEPCGIEDCQGVCAGKFVAWSTRTFGVPLCQKHAGMAKKGELDDDLRRAKELEAGGRSQPSGADAAAANDWTAFWSWAREHGCANVRDFETLTGRKPTGLSAVAARTTLEKALAGAED